MAPPLQGHTLGQRQKFYNELVDIAMKKKNSDIPKINFDKDDVDNMTNIDMACKERNVEYILDVFKCEDMLYVSRVINKSTWLVTDPQYAHIVNPKHLHSELFAQMNAKSVTKLMLHIRRHLKDEVRVKAFYRYINERNPKAALRWLGNCPLKFIERIVATRANEIPMKLLKRLFKKSKSIIRIFLKHRSYGAEVSESNVINEIKYLLKNKKTAEDFLDIVVHCERSYLQFNLNRKYTNMIMKTCQSQIKELFPKYYEYFDLWTFVRYLKTDEIKSFLMNISHINSCNWKSFQTLTPFLNHLPREETLEFLSALYGIEYEGSKQPNEKDKSNVEALFYEIEGKSFNNFSNIYRWYRFAPFDIAFHDLKKFIFAESAPEERHSMLIVLLTCASNEIEHVKTVLQYYHDKHINEPYLHKKTFINSFLSQFDAFRFDDSTWNTLNTLFHSSEVYIESKNPVQEAITSIILRSVIRNQPVHEVVEEKLEIASKTLKQFQRELNSDEQDKVFNYLHDLIVKRINLQSTVSEIGMCKAIKLLKTLWSLINDWNKVESHHRFVIKKIAEFGEINKASSWIQEMQKSRRKRRKKKMSGRYWNARRYVKSKPNNDVFIDIPSIYRMVKSYRKDLFEKSLVLNSSEDVLLNALKHDPGLLTRYKTEIDILRINDEISLIRFLRKLRIYWLDSLALDWSETNRAYLIKLSGHRSLVRGILTLMPRNEALDFIKRYTPHENKIQWSETNEIELSIQKHIAKNMHIVRPQLPAEVVLCYAKGDYLQYALLSLCTMYYNLRSSDIRKYIALMLDAPVSLQKHGIRLAFVKYNKDEKIDMAAKSWKKTKNSSIRTILFTSMFDLLCLEKKTTTIKAIWLVLRSYIDDLNQEENRRIYETLGKVCEVPLTIVGDFFQKAYLFVKSLPDRANMNDVLISLEENAETFIEYLDPDFVEISLLHSITDILGNTSWSYSPKYKTLSAYILCSKTLEIQMKKYNNLLQPVFEICISKWIEGEQYLLEGIQSLLGHICSRIPHFVFEKEMKMPVEILSNIRDAILKGSFCVKEHYIMIRRWQLTVRYVETLDIMNKSDRHLCWESIRTASIPHIASMCHNSISEDQRTFFPSIYLLFKESLQTFFTDFKIQEDDLIEVLYEMLTWEDCPVMYLLVIDMVPNSGWTNHFERWKNEIKKKVYFHPSNEITMHYFKKFSDKNRKENNNQGGAADDDDDDSDE